MSYPENTQGIKLNPNAKELDCEQPDNNTKICSVPKSHFNESRNYYIHYLNGENKTNIFYDISPILVSLPKYEPKSDDPKSDDPKSDDPKPDDKTSDESKPEKKSKLAGIIAGSVVGGLVLIGIILFIVIRYYKKRKINADDINRKVEIALLAINKEDVD